MTRGRICIVLRKIGACLQQSFHLVTYVFVKARVLIILLIISGFTGIRCDFNINECADNSQCLHGGTCVDLVNGFT